MCEQSMVEKGQDPLDGQTGTGQRRKFATSNVYPALWESQIVSVPVGVHVCLNTAFSGLLGVLFWQTQSRADGQASSNWTLLLPCQLFTADDRQSRFPFGGIPSFSLPGRWWKKFQRKKNQIHLAKCNPNLVQANLEQWDESSQWHHSVVFPPVILGEEGFGQREWLSFALLVHIFQPVLWFLSIRISLFWFFPFLLFS